MIEAKIEPCPELVEYTNRRLIDSGLTHHEASLAGFNERYGRGETSHTVHVWWARRPHTAMRALIFSTLAKDTSKAAYRMLSDLSNQVILDADQQSRAHAFLLKDYKEKPRLLDMFGGGGTIPFESLNLGVDTYSIDSNQLSVFIQRCNLSYHVSEDNNKITTLVQETGKDALEKLRKNTKDLFPLREYSLEDTLNSPVMTYLWTYSYVCEDCGHKFYISKRPWLSKKKGKDLSFNFVEGDDHQDIEIIKRTKENKFASNWDGRKGVLVCPSCGCSMNNISIKDANDELVAIIQKSLSGVGKDFSIAPENSLPPRQYLLERQDALLKEMKCSLPSSRLHKWSGIVNPALYGVETHADFLNLRQRLVLLELIKVLKESYKSLVSDHTPEVAKSVIALLSGLVDQLVDWNCRLSMWIPQNEQVGRAFCGPGVSMLWDYAETDPVLNGPSNLWKKLDRIVEGSRSFGRLKKSGNVSHAYAQKLPFEDGFFDAIVTDPPYYDNIFYTVLADFIFAWKRLLFEEIEPDLFATSSTDSDLELVASKFRSGSQKQAHEDYCSNLAKAAKEASRVLKANGLISFVYSHNAAVGWEALVRAFRDTNLYVSSVQPLSIERKQRPRAMTSEAVNTCLVFVMRKLGDVKTTISREALESDFKEVVFCAFSESLVNSGWNELDAALAVYAQGVGMLVNCAEVDDASDIEVLLSMAKIVAGKYPSFKISNRKSL